MDSRIEHGTVVREHYLVMLIVGTRVPDTKTTPTTFCIINIDLPRHACREDAAKKGSHASYITIVRRFTLQLNSPWQAIGTFWQWSIVHVRRVPVDVTCGFLKEKQCEF